MASDEKDQRLYHRGFVLLYGSQFTWVHSTLTSPETFAVIVHTNLPNCGPEEMSTYKYSLC